MPSFGALESRAVAVFISFLTSVLPRRANDAERLAHHVFVVVIGVLSRIAEHPGEAPTLAEDTATMLADFLAL